MPMSIVSSLIQKLDNNKAEGAAVCDKVDSFLVSVDEKFSERARRKKEAADSGYYDLEWA